MILGILLEEKDYMKGSFTLQKNGRKELKNLIR
jgi:hypothetical protein